MRNRIKKKNRLAGFAVLVGVVGLGMAGLGIVGMTHAEEMSENQDEIVLDGVELVTGEEGESELSRDEAMTRDDVAIDEVTSENEIALDESKIQDEDRAEAQDEVMTDEIKLAQETLLNGIEGPEAETLSNDEVVEDVGVDSVYSIQRNDTTRGLEALRSGIIADGTMNYEYFYNANDFPANMTFTMRDMSKKDGVLKYSFEFQNSLVGSDSHGVSIMGHHAGKYPNISSRDAFVLRNESDASVADVPVTIFNCGVEATYCVAFSVYTPGVYSLVESSNSEIVDEDDLDDEDYDWSGIVSGVGVAYGGDVGIPSGAELVWNAREKEEVASALRSGDEFIMAYDLSYVMEDGTKYSKFGGDGVTVMFMGVDPKYKGAKNLYARYINEKGKAVETDIPAEVSCTKSDCSATFTVKHFSTYALIQTDDPITEASGEEPIDGAVQEENKHESGDEPNNSTVVAATNKVVNDNKNTEVNSPNTGAKTAHDDGFVETNILGTMIVLSIALLVSCIMRYAFVRK